MIDGALQGEYQLYPNSSILVNRRCFLAAEKITERENKSRTGHSEPYIAVNFSNIPYVFSSLNKALPGSYYMTEARQPWNREVILFTSEKCVFCGPVREQLASLQRLYPFKVREVNLTRDEGEGAKLAEAYRIKSLPTVILPDSQNLSGFVLKEELENVLLRHLL